MKTSTIWIIIFILAVAGLIWGMYQYSATPGQYDELAVCLEEKGATFYGTFWCPNCQSQKKLFGKSAKLLPYVECSTPNGKGQLEVCKTAGIDRYPTWTFADGDRLIGTQSLETLAEKTSCPL